jgi:processive 1,2-diacylglycerol beta-glucosyltransferase
MDPAKIRVRGHLTNPRFFQEVVPENERASFRVRNLGLHPDRFTVFLATGGTGANNHLALLPVLAEFKETHQAIVVCGRSHRAFLRVNEWRKRNPGFACHLEGYCENMHLLTQVSDAIVTRGGTTTCAKALHYGCPIILNGMGGVMPQERLTAMREILQEWRERPESYTEMRERLLAMRSPHEQALVVREIIDLAREAAQAAERAPAAATTASAAPAG